MLKQFSKTPRFLLGVNQKTGDEIEDDFVWFSPLYDERYADKYFRVKYGMVVPTRTSITLSTENREFILEFGDDENGLYPSNNNTLYEILFSFYGPDVLVYPQWTAGKFFLRLEGSRMYPRPSNERYRYIGAWRDEDSPYTDPKIRIHTVKELDDFNLLFYYQGSGELLIRKVLLQLLVNRVSLQEVDRITPEIEKKARKIFHPDFVQEQFVAMATNGGEA